MHSYYSLLFPLLTVSLLHAGAPVQSNSPHSPFTQLRVLSDEINSVKESLQEQEIKVNEIKRNESASNELLEKNKQLTNKIEQLAEDNKNLREQVNDLNDKIESQSRKFRESTQDLSKQIQNLSEQFKENLTKMARNACIKYTIVSGDSLAIIAKKHNTTPDQILSANHLQDARGLHVGDTLLIPQEVVF